MKDTAGTDTKAAFTVTAIDHVQVAVPPGSQDRSRAFYVDILGMAEIDKPAALKSRGGLWVAAGGQQLHLGVEQDFRPARKAHPAFRVDNIDSTAKRIAEAGYDVAWASPQEIPGRRRFFTADPFGNRLEFIAEL
ncbi:VOC family protein [Bauldia sp.]|uniref:VOC family protein n=1 Tax=Bauldia sp. TaxID=2575872 RepID=UPI003BAB652C